METKECISCKQNLPIDHYEVIRKKDKKYNRAKCKDCRLQETRVNRQNRKLEQKEVVTHKICTDCNVNKIISEFNKFALSIDGYAKFCRECQKNKRHSKITIEMPLERVLICNKCHITKCCSDFRTSARSSTGYFRTCNSCWKPKEWNKDKQKESERRYVENNMDKIRAKWKKDGQKINKIIRNRLNKRIKCAFSSLQTRKTNQTVHYIGCDITYLKLWFEFQFNDRINWDNYGEWHIDHVIPCSNYDLTKEADQLQCFNWKNLRPCLAQENLTKSNKICNDIIEEHSTLVSKFLKVNPLPTHPGNSDEGAK